MKPGTREFKWFLLGLFLIFAGLEIAVTLTYLPRWLGLVSIILGALLMVFLARGKGVREQEVEEPVPGPEGERGTLAETLISVLTIKGRARFALPLFGAAIIVLVYVFNILRYDELVLGVNDTIAILLGVVLILYNYIPENFGVERDFVLLFFVFLFLILVVPLTLYSLYNGPIEENVNSPFVYYLLAEPTAGMLNLFGISASAHMVSSPETVNGIYLSTSGVYITYENLGGSGGPSVSSVMIGLSCTGLYSVSIFISGFTSFILMEYRRFDVRVASLLILGVLTSWFANILRMAIIVAVGSYYGSEALEWTHANLGIIIFMIWVGLFWGLMFRLLVPLEKVEDMEDQGDLADEGPGDMPSDVSSGQETESVEEGGTAPQ